MEGGNNVLQNVKNFIEKYAIKISWQWPLFHIHPKVKALCHLVSDVILCCLAMFGDQNSIIIL